MAHHQPLNAQCFVKKEFHPIFIGDNNPQLLYVCKVRPDISSRHPRIMHSHEDLVELVLIYSGESDYLIHDKKCTVKAGDLLIYNPGVVHDEMSGPDSLLGFITIAVGGLHMPGLRENALIPDEAGYLFQTGHNFEDIRQLLELMFRNLSEEESDAEGFCNSLMHALLRKVLMVVRENTGDVEEKTNVSEIDEPNILGHRVKTFIDANYTRPITLQTIAKALNTSPYYISHVFKEMSGYSPIQYLLRRRIGEAQTLLITTDYSITEIAGMVGYDTQSYFNMQFTKHVGMPPKKFRQNYIVSQQKKNSCVKKPRKK